MFFLTTLQQRLAKEPKWFFAGINKILSRHESQETEEWHLNWACIARFKPAEVVYFLIIRNKTCKSDLSPGLESSWELPHLLGFLGVKYRTALDSLKSWSSLLERHPVDSVYSLLTLNLHKVTHFMLYMCSYIHSQANSFGFLCPRFFFYLCDFDWSLTMPVNFFCFFGRWQLTEQYVEGTNKIILTSIIGQPSENYQKSYKS